MRVWLSLAIALSAWGGSASAHEHQSHAGTQTYDPWCCNMQDCTPMKGSATQLNGKWQYTNEYGNTAAVEAGYTKFFDSKDGQTHACVWREGPDRPWRLRCLYLPGGN